MISYKNKKNILLELKISDFNKALNERNFDEMSNVYNEMMCYDDAGSNDIMDKHIFTEVLEGYAIKLPNNIKNTINYIGKNFYYILADGYILYEVDNCFYKDVIVDKLLDYLKTENIEANKVEIINDTITFTPTAIKTLRPSIGDIIKISLLDKTSFALNKFESL